VIQDEPGRETVVRIPHRALRDRRGNLHDSVTEDPRVSVTIWDDSFPVPLRLYFAHPGDDAPLVGFEVGDENHTDTTLAPAEVARVVKSLPVYTAYARAHIEMDRTEVSKTLEILSEIGTTRRGLPGKFLRVIANEYEARVHEGDPAPITSIAAAHGKTKSTASRWIKEARRRGYIKERGTSDAS
jgi:hypothetical protein